MQGPTKSRLNQLLYLQGETKSRTGSSHVPCRAQTILSPHSIQTRYECPHSVQTCRCQKFIKDDIGPVSAAEFWPPAKAVIKNSWSYNSTPFSVMASNASQTDTDQNSLNFSLPHREHNACLLETHSMFMMRNRKKHTNMSFGKTKNSHCYIMPYTQLTVRFEG